MSHKYSAIKNKQQKHSNVNFHQYLRSPDEPQFDIYSGPLAEFDADSIEDSFFMKRRIRNIAQSMRNRLL